jgi:hypothetical protein
MSALQPYLIPPPPISAITTSCLLRSPRFPPIRTALAAGHIRQERAGEPLPLPLLSNNLPERHDCLLATGNKQQPHTAHTSGSHLERATLALLVMRCVHPLPSTNLPDMQTTVYLQHDTPLNMSNTHTPQSCVWPASRILLSYVNRIIKNKLSPGACHVGAAGCEALLVVERLVGAAARKQVAGLRGGGSSSGSMHQSAMPHLPLFIQARRPQV